MTLIMNTESFTEISRTDLITRVLQEDSPRLCYTENRFPLANSKNGRPSDEEEGDNRLYEVRVIDNDHNTYQQVMDVTMMALGIDEGQAFAVAWEVDHRGYCVVARGPLDEANAIAHVIRTIGIEVQVNPIVDEGLEQ
jgi:ATP-dependent Clp protease adapter protein ClpS